MSFTTRNCIVCHATLTGENSNVKSAKFDKNFNIFCKCLNVELTENSSWDFSKENCPLCLTCLVYVEDVSFNFNLLETIHCKILTVTQKVGDIVCSQRQDINKYYDHRVKEFRDKVIQGMQDQHDVEKKCLTDNLIVRILNQRVVSESDGEHDEDKEDYDDDNFFDSFVNRNAEQLQLEDSSSMDYDSGPEFQSLENDEDDGDSYHAGLTDDDVDGDEYRTRQSTRSGPKSSKFAVVVKELRVGSRSKVLLTELADAGQYSYAGVTISKVSDNAQCMQCKQQHFKLISEVVRHIEYDHLGNKMKKRMYPCQICGQMLTRKKFKSHNEAHQQHQNKTRHKCKICSTVWPGLKELKQHQAENHRQIHEEALLEFPPLPARIVPSATPDGNLNYMGCDILVENDKSYRCALCPHKGPYRSRKMTFCHIRDTHIDPPKEGPQMLSGVPVTVTNGTFSCDLCPDRAPYRLKRSIIGHIKDKHLERDRPWLKCDVCSKEYRTLTMLNIHKKSHQNSSYHWFCDSCGKFFNSEIILRHHKKQVHDRIVAEKKFTCSYAGCEKKYTSSKLLEIHYRVHSKELPFKCEYCDKRFRQEKMKKVHFRRKHAKETPFKCNFCTQAFHDSTFVQSHLRAKHPEVTDRRKGLGYQIIYNIRPILDE